MQNTCILALGEHVYKARLIGDIIGGEMLIFATSFDEAARLYCEHIPHDWLKDEDYLYLVNEALNADKDYFWDSKRGRFI